MPSQFLEFKPEDRTKHVVLVVDDDPVSRYTTVRWLEHAGFRTQEAATGLDGLAAAGDAVSAMVLDVHLPDIDGFELCRQLRSRPDTARLPVLHLSAAYVTDEDKVKGLDSGADVYLTHPVDPAVLVASVQALIRTRVAEEALRLSEAQFRAIYERTPAGICLLESSGCILDANPSMLRSLGRRLDEIAGRPLSDLAPAEFESVARVFSKSPSADEATEQFPLVSADGSRLQMQWTMLPHVRPGVNMVLATDVTGLIQLEEQRQQAMQRERTARTEAERLTRMKDEFIAVLSHELRSPLASIMGWVHVLRRSAEPSRLQRGLEVIERSVTLQTRLASDLLDMSSVNLGKMRLSLTLVNLPDLLTGVIEASKGALDAKRLQARMSVDGRCPPVRADLARLQQIAGNLMGNAIKFSREGGEIRVQVRAHEDGVLFTIADDGQGIAPEFLPRLFDRFSQANAGSNRRHGGLGLGLSIVQHLVELHDGSVSVESGGVGRGATFNVWLPCGGPQMDPGILQAGGSDPARADPEAALAGVTLLVVDDDPEICATLELILRDRGAQVHVAHDHDTALAALLATPPHVLLSDIGMPGKDGYALIQEVRRLEHGAHLPAIAITSYAREQDKALALQHGFDAHCAKPIRPMELVHIILRLLHRQPVRRQGVAPLKILFVEDDPALRYGIAREMRAHGHTVQDAENAEVALPLLAEHEFDVLVTDVGLPGTSGDVFAAEARSLQPALRVVFATGLDYIKEPAAGDCGPTVLRKPYTWEAIEAALDAAR